MESREVSRLGYRVSQADELLVRGPFCRRLCCFCGCSLALTLLHPNRMNRLQRRRACRSHQTCKGWSTRLSRAHSVRSPSR